MGETSITALAVAALVVFTTLLFGAWDAAWSTVAYISGDPSWRSESVKRDDILHGLSLEHRFALRSYSSNSIRAKFRVTNTSDTPIGYVQIDCSMEIVNEGGYAEKIKVSYEFGEVLGPVMIHPHSSEILTASSNEYVRSYHETGELNIDNVVCTAIPALSS